MDKQSTVGGGMPGVGMMPDQQPPSDLESKVADLEARVQALEDKQGADTQSDTTGGTGGGMMGGVMGQ